MKTYSNAEEQEAYTKLPEQIRSFLDSQTIIKLYTSLAQRSTLNISQLMIMSSLTRLTLLGLEPESALETNLHQEIHTLSNEQVAQLVEDINTRIFKEAKRRLQENIVELEDWDESELGPRPKPDEKKTVPTDEELDKLVEEEEKTGGWKDPDEEEVGLPLKAEKPEAPANPETPNIEVAQEKSIVAEKLGATPETQTEKRPVETVTSGNAEVKPPVPKQSPTYTGIDPYREQVE